MRATPLLSALAAAALLTSCAPPVPDSAVSGAAFDTPAEVAARREAQLRGSAPLRPSVDAAAATPLSDAEDIASRTRAALGRPAAAGPAAPLPALDRDNPEISREQDFAAVAAARDIEADAARLRAARQQFQLVTPREIARPDGALPSVFDYALGPARPVGTSGAYNRGLGASERRAAGRCRAYRSADIAQEAFLAEGGPARDPLGVDPDGDGNACAWDPAVIRDLARR